MASAVYPLISDIRVKLLITDYLFLSDVIVAYQELLVLAIDRLVRRATFADLFNALVECLFHLIRQLVIQCESIDAMVTSFFITFLHLAAIASNSSSWHSQNSSKKISSWNRIIESNSKTSTSKTKATDLLADIWWCLIWAPMSPIYIWLQLYLITDLSNVCSNVTICLLNWDNAKGFDRQESSIKLQGLPPRSRAVNKYLKNDQIFI